MTTAYGRLRIFSVTLTVCGGLTPSVTSYVNVIRPRKSWGGVTVIDPFAFTTRVPREGVLTFCTIKGTVSGSRLPRSNLASEIVLGWFFQPRKNLAAGTNGASLTPFTVMDTVALSKPPWPSLMR